MRSTPGILRNRGFHSGNREAGAEPQDDPLHPHTRVSRALRNNAVQLAPLDYTQQSLPRAYSTTKGLSRVLIETFLLVLIISSAFPTGNFTLICSFSWVPRVRSDGSFGRMTGGELNIVVTVFRELSLCYYCGNLCKFVWEWINASNAVGVTANYACPNN